jgi:hypothetical protein
MDTWYSLLTTNFSSVKVFGVYVIWQSSDPRRVVKVGQGTVGERLTQHQNDRAILQYANPGLSVTWVALSVTAANGVERFLGDHYKPLVGDRFPDVLPVAVNLP